MTPVRQLACAASVIFAVVFSTVVPYAKGQAKSSKPEPIYNPASHKSNLVPRPNVHPNASGSDNSSCTLITFEGLADLASIPDIQGVQLPDWLSIIEEAAGGDGNFSNEPSPVTIAFWLYGNPTSQTINIPNGASSLSLYYTTYYPITLTGYDSSGNVIATVSGDPNYPGSGLYDNWTQLTLNAPSGKTIYSMGVSGYANYTGIDNLKVCQAPQIASVEVTQAIQQYQTLDDLKTSLSASGQPPVPIIANKPAVLRVYLNPVQDVTNVTINLTGVFEDSESLSLQPNCTPAMQRAQTNGCGSIDFYFTPPEGSWTANLNVTDSSGNAVQTESLNFTSISTDSMRVRGVTVCDSQDTSGNWLCADASNILGKTDFLAKLAPTATLRTDVTKDVVQLNSSPYTTANNGLQWWKDAARSVGSNYGLFDAAGDLLSGRRTTYFGMVRHVTIGAPAGIADNIPSHGALSWITEPWASSDISDGTVAHELGHTLGLKHTNTKVPYQPAGPPGCWAIANDASTDWSFPTGTAASQSNTNYIQSAAVAGTPTLEVGFDVAAGAPIDPNTNFELMSYCAPYWISPQRYKTMISTLTTGTPTYGSEASPQKAKPEAAPAATTAQGSFWLVRGSITGSSVAFDPLFEYSTTGDTGAETGAFSLKVLSSSNAVLFTRNFTPTPQSVEYGPGTKSADETDASDVFSELIPVKTGAASITLSNASGAEIGHITLTGAPPTVTILTPSKGFVGTGIETVTWTVSGASYNTAKILYSADNGATWAQIGEVANAEKFPVNFNTVAGSTQALIRVLVSDGVNTGAATSADFTVPKKKPSLAQIYSPTPNFIQPAKRPVYLSGAVYDVDDGVLTGAAITWSSNVQGTLGTGSPLSVKLKPGNHTITLAGTDSDGNKITTTTNILAAGAPPVVTLTTKALNTQPTTCEYATVNAAPGAQGAPLSLVQYSANGGTSYTTVPLKSLPYSFIVPGSGFLHVVLRAYDTSGQSNATDLSFLTQSPCTLAKQTINFPTIGNQTYGVAPMALKATASSGLPVSYTVTGPATLSGSTLTITGAGQVTVTAAQAGNSTYAPAPSISQTFTVAPDATKTTITGSPTGTLTPGEALTITVVVTPTTGNPVPTGTITFASPNTSYTVTQPLGANGTLVFKTNAPPSGSYTLTATYSGSANFAKSVSNSLTATVR